MPDIIPPSNPDTPDHPQPKKTMQERGIADAAIAAGWLRQENGDWHYPYYSVDGAHLGLRVQYTGGNPAKKIKPGSRRWWSHTAPKDGKYKHPDAALYHAQQLPSAGEWWMVEGEPDYLTMRAAGVFNVFAIFGTSEIPKNLAVLLTRAGVQRLMFVAHNDELGQGSKAAVRIRDLLSGSGIDYEAYTCAGLQGCDKPGGDLNDHWQAIGFSKVRFHIALDSLVPLNLPRPQPRLDTAPPQPRQSSGQGKYEKEWQALREEVGHALPITGYQADGNSKKFSCVNPAHPDKDPSAEWHPQKGYFCWTCGQSYPGKGNAVKLTTVCEWLNINWRHKVYGDRRKPAKKPRPKPRQITPEQVQSIAEHRTYDNINYASLRSVLADMGVDYRLNIRRALAREIRRGDGKWETADKQMTAGIREHIEHNYYWRPDPRNPSKVFPYSISKAKFDDWLDAFLDGERVDPFLLWLENEVPTWDGSPRLSTVMIDLFGCDPAGGLAAWAPDYLFIGAIQRAYTPGDKMDEFPVLIGLEGLGKSALARSMLPPEHQYDWHTDGLTLRGHDKEFSESLLGAVVAEWSELTGLKQTDTERVQALITRQDDGNLRMAYRTDPIPLPRRCVIIGTTNDENPLPNVTSGNRRFVPIVCQKGRKRGSLHGRQPHAAVGGSACPLPRRRPWQPAPRHETSAACCCCCAPANR